MSWKCPSCQLINHDLNLKCPSCGAPTVKNLIEESRKIDQSITLRQHIFNAKTVAIIELFKAVDLDETIELSNKQFRKAQLLHERFIHLRESLFKKKEEIIEEENELRAYQTHLNDLANKLHESERAVLKIENINYDPAAPKEVKPTPVKQSKAKYSKSDINDAANKWNLPALVIQMTCVARNMLPDEAGRFVIESKRKASGQ